MMKRYFTEIFSINYAVLGLFRIGIGALLLCDLSIRAIYGYDLISPYGVIPASEAFLLLEDKSTLSLYFLSDEKWHTLLLFALSAISYLAYLMGYKEKLFGFISLILLFSVQNRNPFILHGGDILLRLFLLLSLFLPIGRFSIETKRNLQTGRYTSPATIAIFIQIGLMYFISALYKSGPEWLNGSALYYAFKIDWISNSLGQSLTQFPKFLSILTYATLILEFSILPLIFINIKREFIRFFLSISIFLFHLCIFLTMNIGTFPMVCLLGSLLLYPGPRTTLSADFKFTFKNNFVFFILISIIACNTIFYLKPKAFDPLKAIFINSGIYQKWSMFSPSPAKRNVQINAVINDTAIDLKMKYQSHHWQKFFMQLSRPNNTKLAYAYAKYLCKKNGAKTVSIILHEGDFEKNVQDKSKVLGSSKCGVTDASY